MSRAVLITGGTRGIGYAVAEALIKAGDQVAITGTTSDGVVKAEHALSQVNRGHVTGIVCDVRDAASVQRAVETVVAKIRRPRCSRQ